MAKIITAKEPSVARRHIELDMTEEYRRRYIGTIASVVETYGKKAGVPEGVVPEASIPEGYPGRDLVRYSWVWWEIEL